MEGQTNKEILMYLYTKYNNKYIDVKRVEEYLKTFTGHFNIIQEK